MTVFVGMSRVILMGHEAMSLDKNDMFISVIPNQLIPACRLKLSDK